jgi:hypothetical protein
MDCQGEALRENSGLLLCHQSGLMQKVPQHDLDAPHATSIQNVYSRPMTVQLLDCSLTVNRQFGQYPYMSSQTKDLSPTRLHFHPCMRQGCGGEERKHIQVQLLEA